MARGQEEDNSNELFNIQSDNNKTMELDIKNEILETFSSNSMALSLKNQS